MTKCQYNILHLAIYVVPLSGTYKMPA